MVPNPTRLIKNNLPPIPNKARDDRYVLAYLGFVANLGKDIYNRGLDE